MKDNIDDYDNVPNLSTMAFNQTMLKLCQSSLENVLKDSNARLDSHYLIAKNLAKMNMKVGNDMVIYCHRI
uniref:Uncharacterized protein n=1 Tax=Romanomermis culicivorax TaxID=13658 RepID=A0A915IQM8_ROMCU